MSIDLHHNLKLQQKLSITPQLQQAIKILQLSKLELEDFLDDQLMSNPFLEETEESNPDSFQKLNAQEEVSKKDYQSDEQREASPFTSEKGDYNDAHISTKKNTLNKNDDFNYEDIIATKKTLKEHLTDQFFQLSLDSREQKLAILIVDSIDDSGYLSLSKEAYLKEGFSPKEFSKVLSKIQKLDPLGVAARSLSECLSLQINYYRMNDFLLKKIVDNHLEDLAKKNHKQLCQKLKISMNELERVISVILTLESQPGQIFSSEIPQYVTPDLYIYKTEKGWEISLEKLKNGHLNVSAYYSELTQSKKGTTEEKQYFKEKLKEAKWLIKSLKQREKTLLKVMKAILKKQADFFSYGKERLKPLVLKEIAQETELHESTISRITTNKFVQTEQGLFELRSFFGSRLNSPAGSPVSSSVAKHWIERMIKEEDTRKPLSDSKIQKELKEKGIDIARRTVTKYREQLGFLSSSRRTRYH